MKRFKEDNKNKDGKQLLAIEEVIKITTESIVIGQTVYLEIREKIARSIYYLFNIEELYFEQITWKSSLKQKNIFINPDSNSNF